MEIAFRPATIDDLELLLAWRSHPKLYKNFLKQNEPLYWEEHIEWWKSRRHRRDWIIMAKEDGCWRDIGSVNVSSLDTDNPEVGVFIGEIQSWGRGIATRAVRHSVSWLQEQGYPAARARILDSNESSRKLFEKIGFRCIGVAGEDESEYEISLC